MKTYKLTTLRDVFEQVPIDKIEACLAEVAHGMMMTRMASDLLDCDARLEWPEVCEWTDDDDKTMELKFSDGQSDEVLTLTTQQVDPH